MDHLRRASNHKSGDSNSATAHDAFGGAPSGRVGHSRLIAILADMIEDALRRDGSDAIRPVQSPAGSNSRGGIP
jgi:hypothetical protein